MYSEEEMKRKYKPFISIGKSFDDDFTNLLEELFFLIRNYGLDKVGIGLAKQEFETFAAAVHEGWKKAQILIIDAIIDKKNKIISLDKLKKEHHRRKEKDEKTKCINLIEKNEMEIFILRRFIDSLVWIIFNNEHSSIRRLPLQDKLDNLTLKVIEDSIETLNEINSDPLTIAVLTDLTTFVHTGDIITLDLNKGISIIELKSGDKNLEFCEAANFSINSECEYFDENFLAGKSITDTKHYNRTKNQLIHLKDVSKLLNNGEGYDHYAKSQAKIIDKNYIPEFFNENIVDSWRNISLGKNWDIHVIDSCIYVGVYRDSDMGFVGFNTWMDSTNFKGTVYNLTDSFKFIFSRPLINTNLPDELIIDVIKGNVIVVLCLDHSKFYKLGNDLHPGLFKLKNITKKELLSGHGITTDGKGIYSEKEGFEIFIGTGFITRMIFDFQRPKNIVEWIYKDSKLRTDELKQKNKTRKNVSKNKKRKIKAQKKSRINNR